MQNPFPQERGAGLGASGEGRRACAALGFNSLMYTVCYT